MADVVEWMLPPSPHRNPIGMGPDGDSDLSPIPSTRADETPSGSSPFFSANLSSADTSRRLGEALADAGLVTLAVVEEALATQRRSGGFLGHWLIEQAGVDARDVAAVLGPRLGVGYADLERFPPGPDAVALVEPGLCRSGGLIPWRLHDDCLAVAMVDPLQFGMIDRLRQQTGRRIEPWLTFPGEWGRACSLAIGTTVETSDLPLIGLPSTTGDFVAQPEESLSPVVRRVDAWLETAVGIRASDIHWEPMEDRLRVRMRVDGTLLENDSIPRDRAGAVLARLKVMAGLDVTETRRPQDGRFRTQSAGRAVDIRLSSMPTVWGEKLVARLHGRGEAPLSLVQLGLDPMSAGRLETLAQRPWGMVLVAGPTGSGKSTTLSSVLHSLNHPSRNIATLEDPVEHPMPGVNHIAVQPRIGLTFAAGLRSLLRQDPDVLLVGEIRDPETASLAIQAASTGHLLLSTVHAESAVGSVGRMTHLGCDRWLLAQCLAGLVGQRLAPLVCDDCAVPDRVPDPVGLGFGDEDTDLGGARRGRGCVRCQQRGTRGRMGLFEVALVDERFREQMRAGGAEAELLDMAMSGGMRTMADSARDAIRTGRIPWSAVAPLLRGSEA